MKTSKIYTHLARENQREKSKVWLLRCSESALRERLIARVVIVNSEHIATEFVSVVIRFTSIRKCPKMFEDVRGCSQSV
jgi:hypothetical protein